MGSRLDVIRPETSIHHDNDRGVLVAYQPPVLADMHNTWERLATVANISGFTIAAFNPIDQEGRFYIDLGATERPHPSLRPGTKFADACKRRSEVFRSCATNFDTTLGVGHSLGSVAIGSLYLLDAAEHVSERPLFDAIEIADGFNLGAPQSIPQGYGYYALYQLRDFLARRGSVSDDLPAFDLIQRPASAEQKSEMATLRRINNVSALMRSTLSREVVLTLAGSSVPLHVRAFTHGLSGSQQATERFLAQVRDERQHSAPRIPVHTGVLEGWHSNLLRAREIAAQILVTYTLLRDAQNHQALEGVTS